MLAKLKSVKLRYKLYTLVMLQLILLVMVYGYSRIVVEKEMLQRLTEHNSQLNYQNATAARDALSQIKNVFATTLNLENPASIRETELVFKQMNAFKDINLSFRNFQRLWVRYQHELPYLRRIAMCSKDGPTVYMAPQSEVFYMTMTPVDASWMQEALARRGDYCITRSDDVITLCRAVINPLKYDKLGVMTVDADFSFVMDNFESHKLFPDQRCSLFIDGQLACGDDVPYAQAAEIAARSTPYKSILIDRASDMIYLYYRMDGASEILSFAQFPYDALYGQVFAHNRGIIIAIALYVLLSFGMILWIVRNILGSLRVFESAFQQIERGQFGQTIDVWVEGELNSFLNAYNHMSIRLKQLIDEVYEKNLAQHKLELQMLRSQINPHFFYNTLEALRMNCMLGREAQNMQMIEHLSAFLRYGVSSSGEPVPLREEIRHLEYYVNLHNLRSEARIELRAFIPDELINIEIIRLVFQPLLENSIQHGLPPDEDQLSLCIMGYQDGGSVVFSVTDDGMGLPDQTAAAINGQLNGEPGDVKLGIGLKNVHRRIRLYYGEPYGLTIQSHAGHGTEVLVRLPFKEGPRP